MTFARVCCDLHASGLVMQPEASILEDMRSCCCTLREKHTFAARFPEGPVNKTVDEVAEIVLRLLGSAFLQELVEKNADSNAAVRIYFLLQGLNMTV